MAIAKKPTVVEPVVAEEVVEPVVTEEVVERKFIFNANDKIVVKNNSELPYFSYFESILPGETGAAMGYETYAYDFLEVM